MAFTVFYAWQSDRDPYLCKDLIREALDEAKAKLAQETGIEVEIDQDTQGVTGSPSMPDTILEKIANCGALVADLTLTHTSATNPNKSGSNPNVMLEYGYALRAADHNLLGVANTAFGEPEQLPFDLRHRRCVTYQASNERERTAARAELAEKLAAALRPMMDAVSASRQFPWDEDFLNEDTKERVTLAAGCTLCLDFQLRPAGMLEERLSFDIMRNTARALWPLAPLELLPQGAEDLPRLRNSHGVGVFLPELDAPARAVAASLVTRRSTLHGIWCGCTEHSGSRRGARRLHEDRLAKTLVIGFECFRMAAGRVGLLDLQSWNDDVRVTVTLDHVKDLTLAVSGSAELAGPILDRRVEDVYEGSPHIEAGGMLESFFGKLRDAAGSADFNPPPPLAYRRPGRAPRI